MMNSDVLAAYYTLFLIAVKIVLVLRGGSVEGIMYFIYGIWTLIFWGNMRVIADAITGKKYIRSYSRYDGKFKIFREERPIMYYLTLLMSFALSGFSAAVIFDIYKF